jgi:hypothetical protein
MTVEETCTCPGGEAGILMHTIGCPKRTIGRFKELDVRPIATTFMAKLDEIEADLAHMVSEFNEDQSYEAGAVAQAALCAVNNIKGQSGNTVDLDSWLWDPDKKGEI